MVGHDVSEFRRGFTVLAMGTFVGKFVALAREIVFAAAFGAGNVASGFRVSQTASIVPANLVAGDLLSAAFAPTYANEVKRDPGRASAQLWGYAVWMSFALSVVAAGVFLARSALVVWIIPGASGEVHGYASDFLSVLSWTIPLYGLSAVLAYALGAHGSYFATSVRPLIQSGGLLGGTALAIITGWIPWLAAGFLAAWILYTILCLFLLTRIASVSRPRWRELLVGWKHVTTGARRIAPLFFLPVALQLSIVLERVFSSFGPDGLIASVDYARTVSESIMSLIAVPLGILGLTQLSALSAVRYRATVRKMSSFVTALMLPISAILAISALPMINLLYARGNFGVEAATLSSGVLVGLSVGLAFQVLGYSLSRALTAVGRNREVLVFTLVALVGQGVVQGVGVWSLGSLAIGLGPSVFGLILTIGCAYALGLLRDIRRQVLAASPAIAITVIISLQEMYFGWRLLIVGFGWALNVLAFASLRRPILEQIAPMCESAIVRYTRRGR
jgi:putative peptidoglycan lipid II flippase